MKTTNIKVTGKVQGVAFRYYTKLKADELSLIGTVQNLDDGSVFIQISGDNQKLDSFIKWCHLGSPASEVKKVTIDRSEGQGNNISTKTENSKVSDSQFMILRG